MTCLFFQRSDLLLLRSVLFLGSPPSLLSKPRTAKCVLNQSSLFVFWKVFHNVKQMQELPATHFFQTFLLSSFMDMLIPKQWWLITNHWPYGRTHPLRLTAQNSKAAGWLATRLDEAMKCQFVFSTSVLLSLFLTCLSCMNCRRKFRSQTSDNMERWKAEQGRGREKRKIRRKKSRSERGRRQKMQMREKVGKSRNTVFFQWFVAPEGRKVGSLKRRVRTQLARGEIKNCTPLWPEAHFEVKMLKTPGVRTTFGSCDVEKVHAVVARSTFRSQNVQNTPFSDHFWKLRCRKSARRCGAKHISKSKCTKHTILGPLLEVVMSKKCTPLRREAHFEVKMYKTHHSRTTFGSCDVEKVHAVVARSTFRSQNVQNTPFSDHFWKLWCRKSARRCGAKHISKWKCTKHTILGPLLEVQMSKKCTLLWREAHFEVKMYKALGVRTTVGGSDVASPLRFTTLHYVTLHHTPLYYTTLHDTTLHNTTTTTAQLDYTPLHSTTLNFTTLRSTTLHYIKLQYTPLHYITLHYAPQHYNYNYTTTLHYTKLHYTTLHYPTLHSTTLHSTTLRYITLHYNTLNDTAPQIDR